MCNIYLIYDKLISKLTGQHAGPITYKLKNSNGWEVKMDGKTSKTPESEQSFLTNNSTFNAESLLAPLLKGLSHAQKLTFEGRDMDLDWLQATFSTNCRYLISKIATHQTLMQQVDKIHLMFRHLYNEQDLNPTFRQLLLNLFAPLAKYILLNPSFTYDPEQPLRVSLEKLFSAAQKLSLDDCHATQHFNQQFEQLVTAILADPEVEHFALTSLVAEFVDSIQQQQQRTNLVKNRLKQAFNGQFLHKKISQNTLYCLQKLQKQYIISDAIFELMQQAVVPALNLRGLNHGCESQEYLYGLKLTHQMIRSVQPHKDLTSRNNWSTQFGAIQQSLKKFLSDTTYDSNQGNQFVAVLKQAQLDALQAKLPQPCSKQFVEPLALKVEQDRLEQKIASIKPGQWVDLHTKDGWVRCQVIVNCRESKALMLANRVGIKVDLLDYDSVIKKLAVKKLRSAKRKAILQYCFDLIEDDYQQQAHA